MQYDESILKYCDPAFAQSWTHIGEATPLFAGFIDAMALVAYQRDVEARVILEGPGFADLFGEDCVREFPNFLFCADRQDRDELMTACTTSRTAFGAIHVDIAWSAGSGKYASSGENFFKTVLSIEHVGEYNNYELLYFAFKDVSARRLEERGLARTQFSSALRVLFDEIFLLNLDTGTSEPIYAGSRPLVNEDGTPVNCGFHTMFTTVHRDDVNLFWRYSNYTYVESELFGNDPAEAITFDMRRHDEMGDYHWERVFITRVASADKRKIVLVCSQNIDEQKDAQRRERELRSQAQTDALTGIFNHGTSEELIRMKLQGLMAGESAVFAIVDVDDFKRVNDTYGHTTGDKLLQAVAQAVKCTCRDEDIVGRMGGDEFVVLFAGENLPEDDVIRERLERCKQRVKNDSASLGIDPPITLSIGAVRATADDNAYNAIFDRADRLLYEVKRFGKDALRFERTE